MKNLKIKGKSLNFHTIKVVYVKITIKQYILLSLVIFTIIPAISAMAAQYYVSQRMDITMRTGPGVSYKIMSMLPSGEGVTMVEYGKEWSKIQTADGKEGWVLTRYMTKDIPAVFMLKDLQDKNMQLSSIMEQIKLENSTLSVTNEKLIEKEKEYNALKQRSSNFLEIEQKYNDAVKQLESQKILIEKCNSQSHKEILYSFSIGAGVLIIGIILGMSAKKRQSSSLW